MRFLFVKPLLVFGLIVLPFVSGGCLPSNETIGLRSDIATIRFGISDWIASSLNYEVAKILLEEKMGVPTTVFDTLMPGNEEVYLYIQNNSIDVFLELWDADADNTYHYYTSQKGTVAAGGFLGVIGRVGWYIPDYLAELSKSLLNYNAYFFSDTIKLLNLPVITNETKLETYSLEEVKDDLSSALLYSWQCNASIAGNASLTDCNARVNQVLSKLVNITDGTANQTALFYTPPIEWYPYDDQIIQQLGLKFVTEVVENPDTNLTDIIVDRYNQNKPFITYFYTPHELFSPFSGVKLSRVQLPEFTPECNDKIPSNTYDCDYPINYLRKLLRPRLQTENIKVFQFLKQFIYQTTDQEYMIGLVKYEGKTQQEAACDWVLNNRAVWEAFLPPDYNVIILPSAANEGVRIFFSTLTTLFILISLVVLVYMLQNKHVRVFKSASVHFLLLILLGSIISYIYVYLLYDTAPTTVTCQSRAFVKHFGFICTFAPLFLKTYRIAWIFQAKKMANSKFKMKDSDLLIRFFQIAIIFSGVLIIWTVVDPSSPVDLITGSDLFTDCTTGWWENGILLFELAFLLYGVYLSYVVRKAPSAFNESKHISIAIYNWVLIGILLQIVLQSVSGSPTFRYVINALQVLLTLPVVVGLLFGPKFYLNVKGKGDDVSTSGLPRSSKSSAEHRKNNKDSDSHHTEEHEMRENESTTDGTVTTPPENKALEKRSTAPTWV